MVQGNCVFCSLIAKRSRKRRRLKARSHQATPSQTLHWRTIWACNPYCDPTVNVKKIKGAVRQRYGDGDAGVNRPLAWKWVFSKWNYLVWKFSVEICVYIWSEIAFASNFVLCKQGLSPWFVFLCFFWGGGLWNNSQYSPENVLLRASWSIALHAVLFS